MPASKGYATPNAQSPLAPFTFTRREPGPTEIVVDILYCGVCHSDLHMVRNEWGNAIYPLVPGHEIVGRVTAVGSAVTKFKVGEHRGHRRHRRLLPQVRPLQARRRKLLRRRADADLCRQGPRRRLDHHGRLLLKLCRRRALRPSRSREPRHGRRRAAALRGHHDLFAAAPLEGRPRQKGWHRRPRRTGPHGAQIRPLLRRAHRPVHHQSQEEGRRDAPRRR